MSTHQTLQDAILKALQIDCQGRYITRVDISMKAGAPTVLTVEEFLHPSAEHDDGLYITERFELTPLPSTAPPTPPAFDLDALVASAQVRLRASVVTSAVAAKNQLKVNGEQARDAMFARWAGQDWLQHRKLKPVNCADLAAALKGKGPAVKAAFDAMVTARPEPESFGYIRPPGSYKFELVILLILALLALATIYWLPTPISQAKATAAASQAHDDELAWLEADARVRCANGEADKHGYIPMADGGILCGHNPTAERN